MNENGNKPGLLAGILITIMAALTILRIILIISAPGSSGYRDPELPEVMIRGSIIDRNGEILALQAPDYGFLIKDDGTPSSILASFISGYTSENAISIENRIDNGASFIAITSIPSIEESEEIVASRGENGLDDALAFSYVERRKLLVPEASFPFIGRTDENLHGISGIEKTMDSFLSPLPTPGKDSVTGATVMLTIDQEMQYKLSSLSLPGRTAIYLEDGSIAAITGIGDSDINELVLTVTGAEGTIYRKEMSAPPENAVSMGPFLIAADDMSDEILQEISETCDL